MALGTRLRSFHLYDGARVRTQFESVAVIRKFFPLTSHTIPGGDLMPPPDLAGNTPVFNILHPGKIRIRPSFGDNLDLSGAHGVDGRLRKRLNLHKPLGCRIRLNYRMATITVSHGVSIGFHFDEKSLLLELFHNQLPCFDTVLVRVPRHPSTRLLIFEGRGIDFRLAVENSDYPQTMSLTDLKIVEVMPGGNLQGAGTKLRIHKRIRNDRYGAANNGERHRPPDIVPVAFIIRVHRDGRVAEHGLRPRGGDHKPLGRVVLQGVTNMP